VKTVRDMPMVTMGCSGDQSPTPYDHPFIQTGAHNPQSKLASQIVAKRCQIQR